ncbi:hypothetical protein Pcinc_037123 [Petrolisthes cinctipes]|uniref:lysozyme n=1 Tax=Petrolisthes cinctipes TaxID=88211 RepID=A0AAE1BTJ2_PETCI|nr:hypothetical protein Pcinc_037123 [Petrolisthes cinctipes]
MSLIKATLLALTAATIFTFVYAAKLPNAQADPYVVQPTVWVVCVRPPPTATKGAFENCVNDLYCAAQTVRNYMAKFSDIKDCDGDGVLDCVDFAYIHNNGGFNCADKSIITTNFYKNFNTCWKVVRAAAAPIAASGVLPPSA